MLVFTRKIGQQVVLPNQDITIDVVEIGKTRVRLGISAPSDTPVHRREVLDRVNGAGSEAAAGSDRRPERTASPKPTCPAASSPADLDNCLAQWITMRTHGRISELTVERNNGRIVIRGSARSYYARQLAKAAVDEVLKVCDGLSTGSVDYAIDVGQVYWHSIGRTQGLAKLRAAEPA